MQNFLRDLLKEASKSQEVTEDKLIEYTDTMVSDKLTLTAALSCRSSIPTRTGSCSCRRWPSEGWGVVAEIHSRLLPVKENFLTRQVFKVVNPTWQT